MGYTTCKTWTPEKIRADLTAPESGARYAHRCLAQKMHRSPDGHILWMVRETSDAEAGTVERYIVCALVERISGHWGYKTLCESSGPYYYDCPLNFLELAPVAYPEWREGVRQHHAKHSPRLAESLKRAPAPVAEWTPAKIEPYACVTPDGQFDMFAGRESEPFNLLNS